MAVHIFSALSRMSKLSAVIERHLKEVLYIEFGHVDLEIRGAFLTLPLWTFDPFSVSAQLPVATKAGDLIEVAVRPGSQRMYICVGAASLVLRQEYTKKLKVGTQDMYMLASLALNFLQVTTVTRLKNDSMCLISLSFGA